MKYLIPISIFLFFSIQSTVKAQDSKWPSLDKSPMQHSYYPSDAAWRNYLQGENRNLTPKIKVTYSSPAVAGRTVFGDLVPYGEEWRVGANEATEVMFAQNVEIGGFVIEAGIYTMHAMVSENAWTVNFSTQRGIWGSANRDKTKDIASIEVPVSKSNKKTEHMAIGFREIDDLHVDMVIVWDNTSVTVPVAFNVVSFPNIDASPGDMAHFPNNSRFKNYLKPEELASSDAVAKVSYGRPLKKGRDIFGGLVAYDEVWRVGANESTELSLYKNIKVGDDEIKAGKYNLYAIPTATTWTLIFNTDIPAWGAANRDESKDAYMIKIPVTQDAEVLEAMGIRFEDKGNNSAEMLIGWDTTRATLKFTY